MLCAVPVLNAHQLMLEINNLQISVHLHKDLSVQKPYMRDVIFTYIIPWVFLVFFFFRMGRRDSEDKENLLGFMNKTLNAVLISAGAAEHLSHTFPDLFPVLSSQLGTHFHFVKMRFALC